MTRLSAWLMMMLSVAAGTALAKPENSSRESIEVKFDRDDSKSEISDSSSIPQIDLIFRNPALVSGITSGADAINRSIESLMESLFYGLLDNEIRWPLTPHSQMAAGLSRNVFSAALGAYVVVDRMDFGPRYSRELWRVQKLPVVLGADGTVDLLDIYLRTDGMRVAEQADISFWRVALNNWFGILPLLSAVLPPSFNTNELYDPVRQIETPFVFPLSMDSFAAMPVGSIRSYGVSGGVNIGIDLGAFADQEFRRVLDRAEELGHGSPYSVFRQGQHRINVLKRSSSKAWVGLSRVARTGHSISPVVGKSLLVFKNVLPLWPGMSVALWPIDVKLEQAWSDRFDQLYEYDLEKKDAQEAYLAAVKGDFAPSWAAHLRRTEQKSPTGVEFHFTRQEHQQEDIGNNTRNFAIERQSRKQTRTSSEVEITDQAGMFHVLEAKQDTEDQGWDVLVGSEETKFRDEVELKVVKVERDESAPSETETESVESPYVFAIDRNPIQMTTTLDIQDRYTTTTELQSYLELLKFFTDLNLDEDLPKFDLRDSDRESARRRRVWFDSSIRPPMNIHVTPTWLGRFSAQASVSFPTGFLDEVASAPLDRRWRAFAAAWGVDPEDWASEASRRSLGNESRWLGAFLMYPFRLLNLRFATADAIREATRSVEALEELDRATTPIGKRDAFHNLFDTDYPAFLTRALLLLRGANDLPRRVSLSAQARGSAPPQAKSRFNSLSGRKWSSDVPFPPPARYRIAQEKLGAFVPGSVRELGRKPIITKMSVATRRLPLGAIPDESEATPQDMARRHVFLRLEVRNMDLLAKGRIYVRFEQSGKIQFGKLELAEKVIEVAPDPLDEKGPAGLERLVYELYLTGPTSGLRNFIFDQAIDIGGEFQVAVAASRDGTIWSDEKSVRFRYDKGRLGRPE